MIDAAKNDCGRKRESKSNAVDSSVAYTAIKKDSPMEHQAAFVF